MNCANFFTRRTILEAKIHERSEWIFASTLYDTDSKPAYRQILGYNNPILRQTPLTGGSLPAVVFLDLDYSICRLCL